MNKEQLIKNTFQIINEVTVGEFVTLRNFNDVLNSSIDNDIDVLIPYQYINKIIKQITPLYLDIYKDNNKYLYGAEPHLHFKHSEKDVHFDIVTGLYYRSLMDKQMFVKINNILENTMLSRKQTTNQIYINHPHPEDEFVHLCCHTVFDKQGGTKYNKRIFELLPQCNTESLVFLLTKSFYKAGEYILDSINDSINNNNDLDLYKKYIIFSKY